MRLKIELCPDSEDTEIVIKCPRITDEVKRIQGLLSSIAGSGIVLSRDSEEFYLSLDDILFFETDERGVRAHTADDSFEVKEKLYKLSEILPRQFVRISKSAILNVDKVYSVERSITSASLVKLSGSYKRVYISRGYYKEFKSRILERRGSI